VADDKTGEFTYYFGEIDLYEKIDEFFQFRGVQSKLIYLDFSKAAITEKLFTENIKLNLCDYALRFDTKNSNSKELYGDIITTEGVCCKIEKSTKYDYANNIKNQITYSRTISNIDCTYKLPRDLNFGDDYKEVDYAFSDPAMTSNVNSRPQYSAYRSSHHCSYFEIDITERLNKPVGKYNALLILRVYYDENTNGLSSLEYSLVVIEYLNARKPESSTELINQLKQRSDFVYLISGTEFTRRSIYGGQDERTGGQKDGMAFK